MLSSKKALGAGEENNAPADDAQDERCSLEDAKAWQAKRVPRRGTLHLAALVGVKHFNSPSTRQAQCGSRLLCYGVTQHVTSLFSWQHLHELPAVDSLAVARVDPSGPLGDLDSRLSHKST